LIELMADGTIIECVTIVAVARTYFLLIVSLA
jgi:hypothetical protein